jgi:hypothetical protein
MVSEENKLWCKILKVRLGEGDYVFETRRGTNRLSSIWWDDICKVRKEENDWFKLEIAKRMG